MRQALSSRDLALVSLNYDCYKSPVPSSFVRVGPSCARGFADIPFKKPSRTSRYTPDQYLNITMSEKLGSGALGVTHRGSIELDVDGEIISHPIVLKLVFCQHRSRRKRLEREHAIYRHLASAEGVEGVLDCYGIFEDTETGTLALIMDDGGKSLSDRSSVKPTRAEGYVVPLLLMHHF